MSLFTETLYKQIILKLKRWTGSTQVTICGITPAETHVSLKKEAAWSAILGHGIWRSQTHGNPRRKSNRTCPEDGTNSRILFNVSPQVFCFFDSCLAIKFVVVVTWSRYDWVKVLVSIMDSFETNVEQRVRRLLFAHTHKHRQNFFKSNTIRQ